MRSFFIEMVTLAGLEPATSPAPGEFPASQNSTILKHQGDLGIAAHLALKAKKSCVHCAP
jgi:hypothetical protein